MFRLIKSYVHDGLVALGVREGAEPDADAATLIAAEGTDYPMLPVPTRPDSAEDEDVEGVVDASDDTFYALHDTSRADDADEDDDQYSMNSAQAEAEAEQAEFLNRPLRPELQNLRPELYETWGQRDADDYGFLSTIGRKFGVPEDVIAQAQERYAEKLASRRIWISKPNEIEGWRQLVVVGAGLRAVTGANWSNRSLVMGIDDQGRYREMAAELPGQYSIARILNGAIGRPFYGETEFNFNRHSSAWRNMVSSAAGEVATGVFSTYSYKAPIKANGMVRGMARQRMQKALGIATHALCQQMDPDLLRAMRATQLTRSTMARWLSGRSDDTENWRDRLQAVRAYPLLSKVLRENDALNDVIDRREPLAPAIAGYYNIPEKGVRNLVGLTWQKVGQGVYDHEHIVQTVGGLSRDLMPRSRADFRSLQKIVRLSSSMRMPLNDVLAKFAQGGGGPWKHNEALAKVGTSDLTDFLEAVSRKLIVPAQMVSIRKQMEAERPWYPAVEVDHHRPAQALFKALPISDLLEGSERWHRNIMRHDDKTKTMDRDHHWPSFYEPRELNGLQAQDLFSSSALIAVGRSEGHCVGGYDRSVLRSNEHSATMIFTLTDGEGAIAGTVEIRFTADHDALDRLHSGGADDDQPAAIRNVWEVEIVQNQGPKNSRVSPEADAAAKLLVRDLQSRPASELTDWLHEVGEINRTSTLKGQMPRVIAQAEYNIWDRKELEAAWEEYSVYLPRSSRKAGLDGFIDRFPKIAHEAWMGQDAPEGLAWWEAQERFVRAFAAGDTPSPAEQAAVSALDYGGPTARAASELASLEKKVEDLDPTYRRNFLEPLTPQDTLKLKARDIAELHSIPAEAFEGIDMTSDLPRRADLYIIGLQSKQLVEHLNALRAAPEGGAPTWAERHAQINPHYNRALIKSHDDVADRTPATEEDADDLLDGFAEVDFA